MPLEWSSRKQQAVARSSGEAETVALHEAIRGVSGTSKALATAALPTLDMLEQILGRKLELKIMVDASVSKAAAEKGTSRHMRYLSKTQQIDLFWLRDTIKKVGAEIVKVDTTDKLADLLT